MRKKFVPDYEVICEGRVLDLEEKVRLRIAQGMVPAGGVSVCVSSGVCGFSQAMISLECLKNGLTKAFED